MLPAWGSSSGSPGHGEEEATYPSTVDPSVSGNKNSSPALDGEGLGSCAPPDLPLTPLWGPGARPLEFKSQLCYSLAV